MSDITICIVFRRGTVRVLLQHALWLVVAALVVVAAAAAAAVKGVVTVAVAAAGEV